MKLSAKNWFRKISPLEEKIGYVFRNKALLEQALTHRSRSVNGEKSYERLEFLGDAVLAFIVADILFEKYPEKSEGELTMLRSALVNGSALAHVGSKLGISEAAIVEKGLNLKNPPTLHKLLASIVESLIGAIYLDRGLNPARKFVQRWIIPAITEEKVVNNFNYKGQLYEYCQKNGRKLPVFKVLRASGPDHAKKYEVVVYINGQKMGYGVGRQKRNAEQKAAHEALQKLMPEYPAPGK
ncbi:MAG TPA: ribonuclease III [Candidatus Marinimicrobia bacterium]|nr:ribonuclease III [Candidatus Neomarinimicrobiota bacterium]HRS51044.1 ribonuclease III [Candidatus Neomarinimicrobiota bacterium]HRU92551.1 ribonuclease III [Candidatus Neomarinimicrobiota bacterium]